MGGCDNVRRQKNQTQDPVVLLWSESGQKINLERGASQAWDCCPFYLFLDGFCLPAQVVHHLSPLPMQLGESPVAQHLSQEGLL
jgi:hypothetical protein